MTVYYRHDWAGTIQVRGCVEIEQDGEKFIEEAPIEEAQFFGVYVGQEDGPMMWHSDHLTEEQANAVAQRLLCRGECLGVGKCTDQGCPAHYAAEPAVQGEPIR